MRWRVGLFALLLAGVPLLALAGDIQVSCAPGLRVFLDEKLVGLSNAKEDGLYLTGVPEGEHVVRVEADGFVPQSFNVHVRALPVEVKVGVLTPAPPPAAGEGDGGQAGPATGSVIVTSAPQNCTVEIDGTVRTKDAPLLLVEGLSAGEHRVTFSKPGYEPVSATARVEAGATVTIRGDLLAGTVAPVGSGKGSLRVISTPEHCLVQFLGMIREKTRARLNVSHVPAGEHPIVVQWGGRALTSQVVIRPGQRTILAVSFAKGEQPFTMSYEPE